MGRSSHVGKRDRDPAADPRAPSRASTYALWAIAVACATLLTLSLLGLIPGRTPAAPPTIQYSAAKAVDPMKLPQPVQPEVHKLLAWSFPLCTRPREGARLERVALAEARDAYAVWCQGEYVLLEVDATEAPDQAPRVTRLARFPTRGELPGGAAALDLDLDGVQDLALGVAAPAGVVHRPGAGLFFLRGRPQGGYESARALVEMPVVATAAAQLDEQPGAELIALTRGDSAAQRPGELWVFVGGSSPTRVIVAPTALAPSDLAVLPARDGKSELWVAATQPGSLVRVTVPAQRAEWPHAARSELPLRGVQTFVPGPHRERTLYVRDLEGVWTVDAGGSTVRGAALARGEIGPASWLPEGDARAVLAASERGFRLVRGDGERERSLPTGTRVVDADSVRGASGQPRGLLLIAPEDPAGQLALVVLPADVREEARELELRTGAVAGATFEPKVPLE